MKAKTLIELLTLSSNIYLISKDEDFFKRLGEMAEKGKSKFNHLIDEFGEDGEDGEEKLIQKLLHKAKQAKEELELKMEEVAVKAYKKMHIAHTDDLKTVLERIETIEKKLNLIEVQMSNLREKKI